MQWLEDACVRDLRPLKLLEMTHERNAVVESGWTWTSFSGHIIAKALWDLLPVIH